VRIVHAPTTDGLRELAPGLTPSATTDQIPGFGVAGALLALLAAGWGLAWSATRPRD